MSLRDIPIFAGTTITGCAEDLTRPHAEPVDVEWDFPLLNGVKPATIPNGIPTHFQLLAGFLAGPAVGTCKFTWLNGCKLLRSMEYTVESPPPP